MIDYLAKVREFHDKYGHYSQDTPEFPPENVVLLREKLITEEAEEFREHSYHTKNLVEIADALGDLLYVVFGAALAYGIPIGEVFEEIHRSNMTKSMLKDEKSVKGKTIKGPGYEPPRLQPILDRAARGHKSGQS